METWDIDSVHVVVDFWESLWPLGNTRAKDEQRYPSLTQTREVVLKAVHSKTTHTPHQPTPSTSAARAYLRDAAAPN